MDNVHISKLDEDGRKSQAFTGRTTRAKLVRSIYVGKTQVNNITVKGILLAAS